MEVLGGIAPALFANTRAVMKNIPVAIKERGERRESPQSMCPDVQPRPF